MTLAKKTTALELASIAAGCLSILSAACFVHHDEPPHDGHTTVVEEHHDGDHHDDHHDDDHHDDHH